MEMLPDEDAEYDGEMEINLNELNPLIACPHQPDNDAVKDAEKKRFSRFSSEAAPMPAIPISRRWLCAAGQTCK